MRIAALAVHIFTAAGAAVAFCALAAAIEREFAACFVWLGLALLIDGVDGTLARAVDVERNAARFNGEVLDLVVDFLTYVIVPLVALWRAELLPAALASPLCAFVALASAMYFADRKMKTGDNWFRGFPALWNVAVFYLFVFKPAPMLCAIIVAVLTIAMFAPLAFVHPLRVKVVRTPTLIITAIWLASALLAILDGFEASLLSQGGLALGAIYFFGLTLWRFRAPV